MSLRIKVVCLLVLLALLSACARSGTPLPTPEPTRTPKPTFTPTSDRSTLVAMNTDTPVQAALPTDTPVPVAETATSGAYPVPSTAVPTGTGLPTDTPVPTDTTVPTNTPAPTATSLPTNTPVPTATAVPCPEGYDLHVHDAPAFSACYPRDWVISEEESEQGTRRVVFRSPATDRSTGAGLKLMLVTTGPNPSGQTGEEFLKAVAQLFVERYEQALARWPYTVRVDELTGMEAKFQFALPFPSEVVDATGWEAAVLVDNQVWWLVVLGRNEYADELQGIHDEFLKDFHILPR